MNRNSFPPRMKVVVHRPARSALIAAIAFATVLLIGLSGYWLGRGQASLVSSASDDLPAPATPVTAVTAPIGICVAPS